MAVIPKHLERYVVEQDYSRYTAIDQAAWRHIMRQLKSFLSEHAHPCYIEGLARTGISTDSIPHIDVMNEKLANFGWRAVPVSGFIPPAAFMELQSLGVLPIASDMRSVDHLLYTPAPDIVHEAAGHAPILVDPAFAAYLKSYAKVASKAILSREDIDQYEAIRILSDMKEDPGSTASQVKRAEARLATVTSAMTDTSEAAILGRMNWWTAEYGMIGDLKNPKIFGAGLLSSIGESRSAISPAVKKIPLTIDCIKYSYDITEQQPQLFVVPKFENLGDVLEELARTMAFRRGGTESLAKAKRAGTVNTVELDSGLQISGVLKDFRVTAEAASYLSFDGPTQLALAGSEIAGQGVDHHRDGFGSPVGRAAIEVDGRRSSVFDLATAPVPELERAGLKSGAEITLHFESGVTVTGRVSKLTLSECKKLVLITLTEARARQGEDLLFDPAWGVYDMAVGSKVASVYGGPADRARFGSTEEFTKKTVPRRVYEDAVLVRHKLYEEAANLRAIVQKSPEFPMTLGKLQELISLAGSTAANDWLLHTELLEIAEKLKFEHPDQVASTELVRDLLGRLQTISRQDGQAALHIADARKSSADLMKTVARTMVVLHRPIYPRNIGMCARAMGNLGCTNLHIIAPRCDLSSTMVQHEARQGATHGADIFTGATIHNTLEAFLESHGQGVKIAFSARDGYGKRVSDFSSLLAKFRDQPSHPVWHDDSIVQLHFGTEDDGMTLEELELANFICRLPANGAHTSFNLSHAVLIALYILETELGATNPAAKTTPTGTDADTPQALPAGRLEYPKKAIHDWLEALGFDLSSRKINIETTLNRVILSHCPAPDDVRLLEKVLFQTVDKLKQARREEPHEPK